MPQGDKSAYTDKQKRKAEHIEEGYEKRGVSTREAERRAWATVNKQDGGGKRSGSAAGSRKGQSARSGSGKSKSSSSSRKSTSSRIRSRSKS
jgi:plasmid stabilization system protein ParE